MREPNKYEDIKPDPDIVEGLKALREQVENQGATPKIYLIGSTTTKKELTDMQVLRVNPWVFGYKVEPVDVINGLYMRTLYIKLPGEKIMEIPDKDREGIMAAVFETMIDDGNELPMFDLIAYDALMMRQRFAVMFLHEFNPSIVPLGGRRG